jgi:nitrile hydratase subunit alpha
MALSPTTGCVDRLLGVIALDRAMPDFGTLSRRQKVNFLFPASQGPRHLVIDIEPASHRPEGGPERDHRRMRIETGGGSESDPGDRVRDDWTHCVRLPCQRLAAREFNLQGAAFQVPVAIQYGFCAPSIPGIEVVGRAGLGKGNLRSVADMGNSAMRLSQSGLRAYAWRKGRGRNMAHDGHHDDDDHGADLSPLALRVKALESLLVEKGYVDPAALDVLIETYETKIGPRNGARVVAKAWTDPAFADWLARDATAAIASLGYQGRQGEHMVALFNTGAVHNMVVCTLCSCYPWPVLGLPPVWYKSMPYRSRAVIEPREVLSEFGVTLPEETEVRVWDSTAEIRYLVIPQRPAGTEGLAEDDLAALVTRDAMIGTGFARAPS